MVSFILFFMSHLCLFFIHLLSLTLHCLFSLIFQPLCFCLCFCIFCFVPLACLFANPHSLARTTIKIAVKLKVIWHKPGISPGVLMPHCSADLSQISSLHDTLLSCLIFLHFYGPWSPDFFLPYHFTLSLFIYLMLLHKWPFVVSWLSASVPSFQFPLQILWFPFSLCLSVSLCACVSSALLDIFRSFCVVIFQRSVQGSAYLWACSLAIVEL